MVNSLPQVCSKNFSVMEIFDNFGKKYNSKNVTQTIRQTLDPGTGADDLLPNYTPDADPADCRADNLLDSYEKVFLKSSFQVLEAQKTLV